MVWHIPPQPKGVRPKHIGIAPTKADHEQIKAWCLLGVSVREMCERLGEKYKLGKPLSRGTLYHHFRKDILFRQKPGTKKKSVSKLALQNIESEMARMMSTVKSRQLKPRDQSEDED